MPGPNQKPIRDHHKHREALFDDAASKIEDGCHYLSLIEEDLEETGNGDVASQWETSMRNILAELQKLRALAR